MVYVKYLIHQTDVMSIANILQTGLKPGFKEKHIHEEGDLERFIWFDFIAIDELRKRFMYSTVGKGSFVPHGVAFVLNFDSVREACKIKFEESYLFNLLFVDNYVKFEYDTRPIWSSNDPESPPITAVLIENIVEVVLSTDIADPSTNFFNIIPHIEKIVACKYAYDKVQSILYDLKLEYIPVFIIDQTEHLDEIVLC
jgi:hypothetical protein